MLLQVATNYARLPRTQHANFCPFAHGNELYYDGPADPVLPLFCSVATLFAAVTRTAHRNSHTQVLGYLALGEQQCERRCGTRRI